MRFPAIMDGGGEKKVTRLPGEREDVLQSDSALKADEIVQSVTFQMPPASENTAWAQPTGQFTALTANLAVKGDLTAKSSASAGDGNAFDHTLIPNPVVADQKVFAMDGAGYISAHDIDNIDHKLWVSPALTLKDNDVIGGGMSVDGGKLFAVSGIGRAVALDAATGAELWRREIGIPLRSAPRVVGDKVFIITIDSQLMALDVATGNVVWTHRGIGETAGLMNNVSPTATADMVIVPYASGELYALRMDTGDEVWRTSLAQARRTEATAIFSGIGGNPVVDEQVVFAVSSSGLFSVFNVLSGQTLWERKLAAINTPWVVGEYVFVLTEDNTLVAMVKYDGRVRWSTQLRRFEDESRHLRPIVWRGPVMVDGKLVVVSSVGEMLTLDGATGSILSTIDVPDDINSPPLVAGGKILLEDKDATLYSFQ